MNDVLDCLPPMLTGDELMKALAVYPPYDPSIKEKSAAERLVALTSLYDIYHPSRMSAEIYSKIHLATLRSLQKKQSITAVRQLAANKKMMMQQQGRGIISGADCFTIIGKSGIGKSSAVWRAISLIGANKIIEWDEPFQKVIPCLVVQCPFDSSVKNLLLSILYGIDEILGTKYYQTALRTHATTDMLLASVSSACLNHIGTLFIDEIQSVVASKNGRNLVNCVTQLLNMSGISVVMIGTRESQIFFESAYQVGRRTLGLVYDNLAYDAYYKDFCRLLFSYCYVQNEPVLNEAVTAWLYEHSSGGNIALTVALVYGASEIAILSGKERLNVATLSEAYEKRLSNMHGFVEPYIRLTHSKPSKAKATVPEPMEQNVLADAPNLMAIAATRAKEAKEDIVELLKKHIPVMEVSV